MQVARRHIFCQSVQVTDCFVLHLNDWDKVYVEESDYTYMAFWADELCFSLVLGSTKVS